jgi:hypothetical protein
MNCGNGRNDFQLSKEGWCPAGTGLSAVAVERRPVQNSVEHFVDGISRVRFTRRHVPFPAPGARALCARPCAQRPASVCRAPRSRAHFGSRPLVHRWSGLRCRAKRRSSASWSPARALDEMERRLDIDCARALEVKSNAGICVSRHEFLLALTRPDLIPARPAPLRLSGLAAAGVYPDASARGLTGAN